MREYVHSLLLCWAYRPEPHNKLATLCRRLARAFLHADVDPSLRVGEFDARIAATEPSLASAEGLRPVAASFAPLHRSVAIGPAVTLETIEVEWRASEPPGERPVDAEVREWLREVTEPYILWDSPKPTFLFPTDFFYDYVESVPQAFMPPYVGPLNKPSEQAEDPRRAAFRSLSNDRRLFRLSPETVRLRTVH